MAELNSEQIIQIIIDTLKPIGVLRIGLFGSFSRGEMIPGSDIDILVRLPSRKKRKAIGLKWFILDQELEKKIGRPVDLVSEDSVPSALRPAIEKDLKIIYEKAG